MPITPPAPTSRRLPIQIGDTASIGDGVLYVTQITTDNDGRGELTGTVTYQFFGNIFAESIGASPLSDPPTQLPPLTHPAQLVTAFGAPPRRIATPKKSS